MEIRQLDQGEVDQVGDALGLARLFQGNGFYLVAWRGDEPVGHLHLALTDPPELQDLEVAADHRRLGVARLLIASAEREASARGFTRLRVEVAIDNEPAQALYRTSGFADIGLEPRPVKGTIQIRTGPIEVDAVLVTWEKDLARVLADNGRYALAEAGARLLFFERRILPSWMVYVPGLLVVIGIANVVGQLVAGNLAAAGAIAALGVASAIVLRAAMASRRRVRAEPLATTGALVQLDLEGRWLLDGSGQVLAALDEVRVEKSMQVTSSARALAIVWPGGRRVVYRGDPLSFNGSIDGPAEALEARGVPTTW